MMNFQELLQNAISKSAYEILLTGDALPRIRQGSDWVHLGQEKISPPDLRRICFELLSTEQKENLEAKGSVRSFWQMQGQKFYFEVFSSESGLTAHFRFRPKEWMSAAFWNFPKWIGESLVRSSGLYIVASPNSLARDAAIESLLQLVSLQSKKWIVWKKKRGLSEIQSSDQSIVSYLNETPEAADLVVLEGMSEFLQAVELAESGKTVLLNLKASDLKSVFVSASELVSSHRIAAQLKMAMSLRLLFGIDSWVPAYDLIANTPKVQDLIENRKWSQWAQIFEDGTDRDFGMRSLNQSLMQMILKRKIDFKAGFAESPSPQELDRLLAKVGI